MNTETGDVLRLASSAASTAASRAASAALASSPARAAASVLACAWTLAASSCVRVSATLRDGLFLRQLRLLYAFLLGVLLLRAVWRVRLEGWAWRWRPRARAPHPSDALRPWQDWPPPPAASWRQVPPRRLSSRPPPWLPRPSWSPHPLPQTWRPRSTSGSAGAWPSPATAGRRSRTTRRRAVSPAPGRCPTCGRAAASPAPAPGEPGSA